MLIRVISDVHSNLPALEAVLACTQGLEAGMTVCLGDVTGYGSRPSECIALVRSVCDVVVTGNHDSGMAGKTSTQHFNSAGARAVEWTRGRLSDGEVAWLSGLPLHAQVQGLFLCHSDPANPGGWRYILTREAAQDAMAAVPAMPCLVGHTHLPGYWSVSGIFSEAGSGRMEAPCLINCGSVGQPRDGDPRAAFMLVDTDSGSWRHVRVEYDVEAAASGIIGAGLPASLAERLSVGR